MTTIPTETIFTFSINKENWELKKSKLKEKFPHLTDADLDYEEGKVEEFFDNLHKKIGNAVGKTKEGLHKFIEAL